MRRMSRILCSRQKKQLYNFMLRTLYETRTTLGFTDLSTFYRLGALGSIVHPSVEVMVHPGEHNNDAETHLLFSNWESALPYKIAKISYKEI
jgi:hypothetical protein